MSEIQSYRDLDVWNLGMELVLDCYALTSRFPAQERFGLTAQTRRAAVSIPSNVAEGHNRRSPHSHNAYRNHVSIALGSNGELDTTLEIALRLGYLRSADLEFATQSSIVWVRCSDVSSKASRERYEQADEWSARLFRGFPFRRRLGHLRHAHLVALLAQRLSQALAPGYFVLPRIHIDTFAHV